MRGIRRTIGTVKAPRALATNDRLLAMVAPHDGSLTAPRDRVMLLLGFATVQPPCCGDSIRPPLCQPAHTLLRR
jgi:hypothetical protein